MPLRKTAIAISEELLAAVDRVATERHETRNRFVTRVLEQAVAACAPFTRMLRDADCRDNPPWTCVDGAIGYSVSELADVTKPGAGRGGVLCCR